MESFAVLVRKTSRNRITLPKEVTDRLPDTDYFEVREEAGRIVLIPMRTSRANEVQAKLEALSITETDIQYAVEWARHTRKAQ